MVLQQLMTKKLITFSVFGDNPIYTKGLIKNLELADEIYSEWIPRIYLFDPSKDLIKEVNFFENAEVEIIPRNDFGFVPTMFRFLPFSETDVSYFISRDTDSRLSWRERYAVDEWIESGKTFHIMKDHPYHHTPDFPILAGMFGAKGGIIPEFKENFFNGMVKKLVYEKKGIDQHYLKYVYDLYAINDNLTHHQDTFPTPRNFEKDKIHFVGQVFDENDNFGGNWKHDLDVLGYKI